MSTEEFTLGVEEEFLVVDAETGALRPEGPALLPEARARLGGEDPFSVWTEDPSVHTDYEVVEREYQHLAREQIICGVHVHVGVDDPELAIRVVNGVGPWLSPIVAVAANSPFWGGRDTGYASYRTEMWRRWPMAGTPAPFADRAEYDALVDALFRTGSIDDHARIYWDVRPSAKFPTVEFRVADVGLTVDDAVLVAGLVQALVVTATRTEARPIRPELMRAATWRAARYGVGGELIDVEAGKASPAREVLERFLDRLRPALVDLGDWEEVSALVDNVLGGGTGADRQRRVLAESGDERAVLDFIVDETCPAAC